MIAALRARAEAASNQVHVVTVGGTSRCCGPRIVEQAALSRVESNIVFTNEQLADSRPPDAIADSLDGPPRDQRRDPRSGRSTSGSSVRCARRHGRSLIQSVITTRTAPVLEQVTAQLTALPNVIGVIYSLYVPQTETAAALGFRLPERDGVIERLLRLKEKHGAILMNDGSTCDGIDAVDHLQAGDRPL